MFAGLIFRESAKAKRSITSWRDHAKNVLPTHVAGVDIRPVASAAPSFVSSVFKGADEKPQSEPRIGYGFGVQGERAAGLKGMSNSNSAQRSAVTHLSTQGISSLNPSSRSRATHPGVQPAQHDVVLSSKSNHVLLP
jgi:hypothetical protein